MSRCVLNHISKCVSQYVLITMGVLALCAPAVFAGVSVSSPANSVTLQEQKARR